MKHIRDREIERLRRYAQGLGVKVSIVYKPRIADSAAWTTDGSEIIVYTNNNQSKTDIVLSLVHELGHHLWFIHEKKRKLDLKFEEALSYESSPNYNVPKRFRKHILDTEIAGVQYWDVIIKDVDIRIPEWKVKMAAEFDIWQYEVYYKTGKFPSNKEKVVKYKALTLKYRK